MKEYAISVILFILFISGFMIAYTFRITTGIISDTHEKKNLTFESRAMSVIEPTDASDIWTGKGGADKLLISLAQESMYIEALDNGLSVTESQIDEYIQIHLKNTNLSFDTWNQTLGSMGISIGEARHRVRKTLLANENVKRRVLDSINVTEDEIMEFFIQNRDKFTPADPGAKNRLPELNEVRSIINQTIRSRKMRSSGQEYIDNMLNQIVETTLQRQSFSNNTNQSDRMNISGSMNSGDRINSSARTDSDAKIRMSGGPTMNVTTIDRADWNDSLTYGMLAPLKPRIEPIVDKTSEKNLSSPGDGSNTGGDLNE